MKNFIGLLIIAVPLSFDVAAATKPEAKAAEICNCYAEAKKNRDDKKMFNCRGMHLKYGQEFADKNDRAGYGVYDGIVKECRARN